MNSAVNPKSYMELAAQRVASAPSGYKQPEDFGYDFRDWVSPYTKGACKRGGIALVLQDWASEDGLLQNPHPQIPDLGRNPSIRTNDVLQAVLKRVFGLHLSDVYATNVFPFVKPGGMSSPVPQRLVNSTALQFTARELQFASPSIVLALGVVAHVALQNAGISCVKLPHPAARIGTVDAHERLWRAALAAQLSI